MPLRVLHVAVLVGLLSLAGCSESPPDPDTSSSSSTTSTAPPPPAPVLAALSVAAVGIYPVNPAFDPTSASVPVGATVRVSFSNDDTNPLISHNWVIDGLVSSPTIAPGDAAEFEFTAPEEAGSLTYYCAIGDHRERGMEGTLDVTGP